MIILTMTMRIPKKRYRNVALQKYSGNEFAELLKKIKSVLSDSVEYEKLLPIS